jgi:hypothetical protein
MRAGAAQDLLALNVDFGQKTTTGLDGVRWRLLYFSPICRACRPVIANPRDAHALDSAKHLRQSRVDWDAGRVSILDSYSIAAVLLGKKPFQVDWTSVCDTYPEIILAHTNHVTPAKV